MGHCCPPRAVAHVATLVARLYVSEHSSQRDVLTTHTHLAVGQVLWPTFDRPQPDTLTRPFSLVSNPTHNFYRNAFLSITGTSTLLRPQLSRLLV